ncbi:hypothetical protein PtB15_10B29 [Puccinia triticina]|nr:hypothetical protein PtB15_10B29 [Puccinia triticina]
MSTPPPPPNPKQPTAHYSSDSEILDNGRNAYPGTNQASLAGPARVRRSSIRRRVAAPDYTPPLRNAMAPAAAGGPTRPAPAQVSLRGFPHLQQRALSISTARYQDFKVVQPTLSTPSEIARKISASVLPKIDKPDVKNTKFIDGAQEIDVDAVAHKGELIVHVISEHVENAEVHSGDAPLVLPPFKEMVRLKEISQKVAKALNIFGPFNMQIIRQESEQPDGESRLKVIECNLRASRSFPFVSKVLGANFIDIATAAILGEQVPKPMDLMAEKRDYCAIKVPQFPWTRLAVADPFLGVEMASTGEVASFGQDVHEAYWASLLSTNGFKLPKQNSGILIGGDTTQPELKYCAEMLSKLGFKLYCSSPEVESFSESLKAQDPIGTSIIPVKRIEFPKQDKRNLREVFEEHEIQCVINLAKQRGRDVLDEDYVARRNSVDFALARKMLQDGLEPYTEGKIPSEVRSWSEILQPVVRNGQIAICPIRIAMRTCPSRPPHPISCRRPCPPIRNFSTMHPSFEANIPGDSALASLIDLFTENNKPHATSLVALAEALLASERQRNQQMQGTLDANEKLLTAESKLANERQAWANTEILRLTSRLNPRAAFETYEDYYLVKSKGSCREVRWRNYLKNNINVTKLLKQNLKGKADLPMLASESYKQLSQNKM